MLVDAAASLLTHLPPEIAHRSTIKILQAGTPFMREPPPDNPALAISVLGLRFPNPIGIAAGFDKDAQVPRAVLKLGFGFVECGTITPQVQAGNPRPRLFRLRADRAVINRMGFNNAGMEAAARRLESRRGNGLVGVNIGAHKNSADRIEDYRKAFARLAPLADYIAVNVSSPNTPGLRSLQNREDLGRLLAMLVNERARLNGPKPLLLKIAPDLDQAALDDIADVALAHSLDGIIATNTTIERPATLQDAAARESGGLSGAPLFGRSTEVLKALRARVGSKLVLIGVGGVSSGTQAYAKIRAGASLVQLYTALVFQGPRLVARIKGELGALLERDGFCSLAEAVGLDTQS